MCKAIILKKFLLKTISLFISEIKRGGIVLTSCSNETSQFTTYLIQKISDNAKRERRKI